MDRVSIVNNVDTLQSVCGLDMCRSAHGFDADAAVDEPHDERLSLDASLADLEMEDEDAPAAAASSERRLFGGEQRTSAGPAGPAGLVRL